MAYNLAKQMIMTNKSLRNYSVFKRVRKIVKSDYQLHVRPSLRIHLCYHWTDFDEIWYLRIIIIINYNKLWNPSRFACIIQ
jgi:hypothetical protein